MSTRKNKILIKRSNTPSSVPTNLLLGELAINTADVILYASGTTTNSILPIGWDRVSKTGDTMTGILNVPTISAVTISATTFFGDGSNLTGITDIYITGGTYSNGIATFNKNNATSFNINGFVTGDTYTTGVTINNGTLTLNNNNFNIITASTIESRSVSLSSENMVLNTATRVTLTPIVMSVTRFDGTGAIDDAGVSIIIPQDYLNSPQLYFTWRASTTSVNTAKIFVDIYSGDTSNTGSLSTVIETLNFTVTPVTANVFLYSSTVNSSLILNGGNSLHFRIYRNPADVNDTFTGSLDMINFVFKYNSKS